MIRPVVLAGAVALSLAAAVACGGGGDGGAAASGSSRGSAAPEFAFDAVVPLDNGGIAASHISNQSRDGLVTVLYFSFVG